MDTTLTAYTIYIIYTIKCIQRFLWNPRTKLPGVLKGADVLAPKQIPGELWIKRRGLFWLRQCGMVCGKEFSFKRDMRSNNAHDIGSGKKHVFFLSAWTENVRGDIIAWSLIYASFHRDLYLNCFSRWWTHFWINFSGWEGGPRIFQVHWICWWHMFRLTVYICMTGKCSHKQTSKSPYLKPSTYTQGMNVAFLKTLHYCVVNPISFLWNHTTPGNYKKQQLYSYGWKIGYQTNHKFGCIWTIWSNPNHQLQLFLDEKSAWKVSHEVMNPMVDSPWIQEKMTVGSSYLEKILKRSTLEPYQNKQWQQHPCPVGGFNPSEKY